MVCISKYKSFFYYLNFEYIQKKYAVLCTFLPHALKYGAEILHMTFFLWAPDQVWVSTSSLKLATLHLFLMSDELTIFKVQFYALFLGMLWELAEITVKYYKNIAFSNFHDSRIMYRLRCSGLINLQRLCHFWSCSFSILSLEYEKSILKQLLQFYFGFKIKKTVTRLYSYIFSYLCHIKSLIILNALE